jgi:DNA helicase-2/ATP-dependent DNA helicase PcrA
MWFVVEKILENREAGVALKTQAVLFRASHHSAPLKSAIASRLAALVVHNSV